MIKLKADESFTFLFIKRVLFEKKVLSKFDGIYNNNQIVFRKIE